MVSIDSTGLESNINAENNEQDEENRHHDLVGLLNAAANTEHQNDHADH